MIPTKTYRAASMRQDVDVPRHGSRGNAWHVPGAPDSRAFLFQPDGDTNAYYCEESDLDFEECPCLSGQPEMCAEHQSADLDGEELADALNYDLHPEGDAELEVGAGPRAPWRTCKGCGESFDHGRAAHFCEPCIGRAVEALRTVTKGSDLGRDQLALSVLRVLLAVDGSSV